MSYSGFILSEYDSTVFVVEAEQFAVILSTAIHALCSRNRATWYSSPFASPTVFSLYSRVNRACILLSHVPEQEKLELIH